MCNCFKEISENIKTFKEYKKPILSVYAPNLFSSKGHFYIIPFKVSLEGQKKEDTISVIMIYCPICGQKFNEAKDAPSV